MKDIGTYLFSLILITSMYVNGQNFKHSNPYTKDTLIYWLQHHPCELHRGNYTRHEIISYIIAKITAPCGVVKPSTNRLSHYFKGQSRGIPP